MKIRMVELYNQGDRETDLRTKVLELPEFSLEAIKRHLIDMFEVEEEEGADINEMFSFQKKGQVIAAIALDCGEFQVFTFIPTTG